MYPAPKASVGTVVQWAVADVGELLRTTLAICWLWEGADTNVVPTSEAKRVEMGYPDIGAMLLHPYI